MKTLFLLILVSAATLFSGRAFTQETVSDTTQSQQLWVVTKLDGTEYIGTILSDDGREVLIETKELGRIYIPKSSIKSIVKVENENQVVYGEYRNSGPFTTRYSFTTNALPIVKGENYALVHLYGPEVHFAVSNHFSLGIMSTWAASPLVLAAKYSFQTKNEKINLSVGTLAGTSGYLNAFRGFGGLHFANITFGNRLNNITISGGYGYLKSGFNGYYPEEGVYHNTYPVGTYQSKPVSHGPVFSVAGIVKSGSKASFVFDAMLARFHAYGTNVVYSEDPANPWSYTYTVTRGNSITTALFVMPGMRFQSTDRRAFQFSLAGISVFRSHKSNFSFPFPMCTWFFKF